MPRRAILVASTTLALALGLGAAQAPARSARACERPSAAKIASLPREYPAFHRELRRSFGPFWLEAALVSWGEGGWRAGARNGQYLGTFQMGSSERARFGHGSSLAAQAWAAARYFWLSLRERGFRWAPWECKP